MYTHLPPSRVSLVATHELSGSLISDKDLLKTARISTLCSLGMLEHSHCTNTGQTLLHTEQNCPKSLQVYCSLQMFLHTVWATVRPIKLNFCTSCARKLKWMASCYTSLLSLGFKKSFNLKKYHLIIELVLGGIKYRGSFVSDLPKLGHYHKSCNRLCCIGNSHFCSQYMVTSPVL